MLTAAGLLDAWERGAHGTPAERGQLLACAARPDLHPDVVGKMTLGQRNRALFELRSRVFGPVLEAAVRCPRCTAAIEFQLRASDLAATAGRATETVWHRLVVGDYDITFRVLTTTDLSSAARAGTRGEVRHELLARSIGSVASGETAVALDDLPPDVVEAIGDAIIETDPGVEAAIGLDCPACSHAWSLPLDIASYLWTEIVSEAERLLFEIHSLARAYGWREGDVLALSAVRRKAYLDMAAS